MKRSVVPRNDLEVSCIYTYVGKPAMIDRKFTELPSIRVAMATIIVTILFQCMIYFNARNSVFEILWTLVLRNTKLYLLS